MGMTSTCVVFWLTCRQSTELAKRRVSLPVSPQPGSLKSSTAAASGEKTLHKLISAEFGESAGSPGLQLSRVGT